MDLRFDAGIDPQVFPIGSENGGGKSTLLQLVFILLHCAGDEERVEFIRNMMASFQHPRGEAEKLLARFELWDGERTRVVEFVSLGDEFLREALGDKAPEEGFGSLRTAERHARELKETIKHEKERQEHLQEDRSRVLHMLAAHGDTLIAWYSDSLADQQYCALVVREADASDPDMTELLRQCRNSTFLLAPSSQPYLFLPPSSRRAFIAKSLQGSRRNRKANHTRSLVAYLEQLDKAARSLPGFFAYDWLSIEPLLELFRQARDRDFAEAVKTEIYGSSYTDMLRDINSLLFGKQVRPLEDLSGVTFTIADSNGNERELGPEDLSRGELKRLMIYAWLKANRTEHAIVLMDELEVSFHPDWQYGVINDLIEWAPTAQFLLATHSHEMCRAVTPAHVRELEPKLGDSVQHGTSG